MVSRCDSLSEAEQLRLIAMITDGVSWRKIGQAFGIPESTIRFWANEKGIVKSAASAKRELVDSLLIYDTNQDVAQCATAQPTDEQAINAAANRDVNVCRTASETAAIGIKRLNTLVSDAELDVKDCNIVSQALDRFVNAYYRVNKLDEVPQEKVVIRWTGNE